MPVMRGTKPCIQEQRWHSGRHAQDTGEIPCIVQSSHRAGPDGPGRLAIETARSAPVATSDIRVWAGNLPT